MANSAGFTDGEPSALETARRWLARLAVTVFTLSFVGLLSLSATPYWTPENEWVQILDQALRISLLGIVAVSLPPFLLRFGRQAVGSLSGRS